MSFLKNIREALQPDLPNEWKVLTNANEIDELKKLSFEKPVAVFKHSTRCGISSMAKFELENGWDIDSDALSLYYLDLLAYRNVSNSVAEALGVVHQSPQLLLLKDGEVVFYTSHHGVHLSGLKKALTDFT